MGTCPKCNEEIDCLRAVFIFRDEHRFDKNGIQERLTKDPPLGMPVPDSYLCPECFEQITTSKDKALEILNKTELEDKVERASR